MSLFTDGPLEAIRRHGAKRKAATVVRGRFGLRPPDPILAWWTGFAAFFCCLSLLLPGWSARPIWLAALLVAVTAAVCLDIALGVILLRLKDDPNRWLNAYALSHIVCGLFIIASTMF